MGKKLTICCLFFFPFLSQGQITVYNNSLVDSTKSELFWFLDNDLIISGINEKDSDIKLSKGQLKKISDKVYRVTVERYYNDLEKQKDTLFIYAKKKLIYTKVFDMQLFLWEGLYFYLGSRKDSLLSVREIVTSPTLKCKFPKSNYKYSKELFGVYVNSFYIQIKSQGLNEVLYSREVIGSWFSQDDIKEIKKMQTGDKIIISNIRVAFPPNWCSRDLDSQLTFEIK